VRTSSGLEARAKKRKQEAGEVLRLRIRVKQLETENARLGELVNLYRDKARGEP